MSGVNDLLKDEICTNCNFYNNSSSDTTDVIQEVDSFLNNPLKCYKNGTVDLFLYALCKALSVAGKVFRIDTCGTVREIEIGAGGLTSDVCYFARTEECHVDAVVDVSRSFAPEVGKTESGTDVDNTQCKTESSTSINIDTTLFPIQISSDEEDDGRHIPDVQSQKLEEESDQHNSPVDFHTSSTDTHGSCGTTMDFNYENPSTNALLEIILNHPETIEQPSPLKGVREKCVYTIKGHEVEEITADDNGAYHLNRSTSKLFYAEKGDGRGISTRSVHELGKRYFYKQRVAGNTYEDVGISSNAVYSVERYYRQNKSMPGLRMMVVKARKITEEKHMPYICVVYNCDQSMLTEPEESYQILPHGRTKNKHKERPYIRTSKSALDKVDDLLSKGKSISETYDTVLMDAGGPCGSASQSSEPRDKPQIIRRKRQLQEKEPTQELDSNKDCILNVLHRQKSDDFIESVVVKRDVYYFFLANEIQLDDVVKFCCAEKDVGVLGVDTTFNLCKMWLTDTCYRNKRLVNPRTGDHPIFLGPALLHFTKDESTFQRFALEMVAAHPGMINLKKIGVDMEKAIFNGIRSIFRDLQRLLCVKHLCDRDKIKLKELLARSSKSQSQRESSIEIITKDIYGYKYGSVYEYGLAESSDRHDLEARLDSLKEKWETFALDSIPGSLEKGKRNLSSP